MIYPLNVFTNPSYSDRIVEWAIKNHNEMEINRPGIHYDKLYTNPFGVSCTPRALPGLVKHFVPGLSDVIKLIEAATINPNFTPKDGDQFVIDMLYIDSLDELDVYNVFLIDENDDSGLCISNMNNPTHSSFVFLGPIIRSGKLSLDCLNTIHDMFMQVYDIFEYEMNDRMFEVNNIKYFDYFSAILHCPIATDKMIVDAIKARHGDASDSWNTIELLDDLICVLSVHPEKLYQILPLCRTFGLNSDCFKKEMEFTSYLLLSRGLNPEDSKSFRQLLSDSLSVNSDPMFTTVASVMAFTILNNKLDIDSSLLSDKDFKGVISSLLGDSLLYALTLNELPNLSIFSDPRMSKTSIAKIHSIGSVNHSDYLNIKFAPTNNGEIKNIRNLSADDIEYLLGLNSHEDNFLNEIKAAVLHVRQVSESTLSKLICQSQLNKNLIYEIGRQDNLSSAQIINIIKAAHSDPSISLLSHTNADKNTLMELIKRGGDNCITPYGPERVAEKFSNANRLSLPEVYELFEYCREETSSEFYNAFSNVFATQYVFKFIDSASDDASQINENNLINVLLCLAETKSITNADLELLEPHLTLDLMDKTSELELFTSTSDYPVVYERLIAKSLKEKVESMHTTTVAAKSRLSL